MKVGPFRLRRPHEPHPTLFRRFALGTLAAARAQSLEAFQGLCAQTADGGITAAPSGRRARRSSVLEGVVVRDASGNVVTGYSVGTASGFDYAHPVPEPASLAGPVVGALGILRRRRPMRG